LVKKRIVGILLYPEYYVSTFSLVIVYSCNEAMLANPNTVSPGLYLITKSPILITSPEKSIPILGKRIHQ